MNIHIIQIKMINMSDTKMRTVNVNERGQLVIPEDIRRDFGIREGSTLVMIERQKEIVLIKESDALEAMGQEGRFWKTLSQEAMKSAWSREDEIWDKIFSGGGA